MVSGERPRAGQMQVKPTAAKILETMKAYGFGSGFSTNQWANWMSKSKGVGFKNSRSAVRKWCKRIFASRTRETPRKASREVPRMAPGKT